MVEKLTTEELQEIRLGGTSKLTRLRNDLAARTTERDNYHHQLDDALDEVEGLLKEVATMSKLKEMVYHCVSLRDVMSSGLSQQLYNDIVGKFEGTEVER